MNEDISLYPWSPSTAHTGSIIRRNLDHDRVLFAPGSMHPGILVDIEMIIQHPNHLSIIFIDQDKPPFQIRINIDSRTGRAGGGWNTTQWRDGRVLLRLEYGILRQDHFQRLQVLPLRRIFGGR
jgi:hypothetical protein